MSDVAETAVPIGADVSYRLTPRLDLGGSLVFAPAFGDDSAYCVSCGLRYDFQLTGVVRLFAWPTAIVSPWVSYGAGWEALHVNFASSASAAYQGPIVADVQLGLDLRKKRVAVGPYLGVTAADFVVRSLDPAPPHEPSASSAFHAWFTVGLHGSYSL